MARTNWVRMDAFLPLHQKMEGLEPAGKWLYAASVFMAKRDHTDGFVRAPLLVVAEEVDSELIEVLILRGLWHRHGHSCPSCPQPEQGRGWVVIHDYLEWQESQEAIKSRSETFREAGRRGAQKRWAKADPKARAKADPMTNPNSLPIADSDSDSDSSVAHSLQLTEDEIRQITSLIGGGPAHARKTVAFIVSRSAEPVGNPLAYALKSIRANPAAYRYRRGNPRNADDWCPEPGHEAEWADNCRQCALLTKLTPDHPADRLSSYDDEPEPEPDWTEDI